MFSCLKPLHGWHFVTVAFENLWTNSDSFQLAHICRPVFSHPRGGQCSLASAGEAIFPSYMSIWVVGRPVSISFSVLQKNRSAFSVGTQALKKSHFSEQPLRDSESEPCSCSSQPRDGKWVIHIHVIASSSHFSLFLPSTILVNSFKFILKVSYMNILLSNKPRS